MQPSSQVAPVPEQVIRKGEEPTCVRVIGEVTQPIVSDSIDLCQAMVAAVVPQGALDGDFLEHLDD
jgi:hypothetical protein